MSHEVMIEDVFRDVNFVDGIMVNGTSADGVRTGDHLYVDRADGDRIHGQVGMIPFPGNAGGPAHQVSFEITGPLGEEVRPGDRVAVVRGDTHSPADR